VSEIVPAQAFNKGRGGVMVEPVLKVIFMTSSGEQQSDHVILAEQVQHNNSY
jgi:hypothetical protein